MHKSALFLALPLLAAPLVPAFAVDPDASSLAEREAVEAAALDYVEGIYQVEPERVERSVHDELTKYGFWRRSPEDEYRGMAMTKPELVDLAARWNADGSRAGADSPKEVVVLDLMDQTAAVKVTAAWGVDYMHLAKYEGTWKIVHVMWQSHPPEAQAPSGSAR